MVLSVPEVLSETTFELVFIVVSTTLKGFVVSLFVVILFIVFSLILFTSVISVLIFKEEKFEALSSSFDVVIVVTKFFSLTSVLEILSLISVSTEVTNVALSVELIRCVFCGVSLLLKNIEAKIYNSHTSNHRQAPVIYGDFGFRLTTHSIIHFFLCYIYQISIWLYIFK